MAKTLYVVDYAAGPGSLRAAVPRSEALVAWAYLCQDYVGLMRWERALGDGFARISLKTQLADSIERLRRPFLGLMAALGRRHASLAWWSSRVSERNTAISPLFLYCCYREIGHALLAAHDGPLCIVTESRALASLLEGAGRSLGYSTTRISEGGNEFPSRIRGVLRAVRFIFAGLRQKRLDDGFKPGSRPLVLLRTWVSEDCLTPGGAFSDRYLPGLQPWLQSRGYEVAHLPVLHNLRRSVPQAWAWFRASPLKFVNPYRFYAASDYVNSLREAMRASSLPSEPVVLEGADVTALFREARRMHALDAGTLEALLSYWLPKRLRERGIEVGLFVDEYENMIPEKALIAGFRQHSHRTRLVGFQHGALYPALLCNFMSPEEAEFGPLVDRIVCNGVLFRDILAREGLPAERLVAGPALRYAHLWRNHGGAGAARDVFVPMPMMRGDAAELLSKLVAAFAGSPRVPIRLKAHPSSSLEVSLADCGLYGLPANFEVVTGDIGPLLAGARVVVALSSSALYEALAAGVPVVSVGRESALDLNPLAWHEHFSRQFSTPEEIRDETLRLLQLAPADFETYRVDARRVLEQSFGRVTDETLSRFVEGSEALAA